MIDIINPNRFYQMESADRYGSKLTHVIDLKHVIQIVLRENEEHNKIIIDNGSPHQLAPIEVAKEKIASEEYKKIITAWTTYKIATEK